MRYWYAKLLVQLQDFAAGWLHHVGCSRSTIAISIKGVQTRNGFQIVLQTQKKQWEDTTNAIHTLPETNSKRT